MYLRLSKRGLDEVDGEGLKNKASLDTDCLWRTGDSGMRGTKLALQSGDTERFVAEELLGVEGTKISFTGDRGSIVGDDNRRSLVGDDGRRSLMGDERSRRGASTPCRRSF